MREAFAKCLVAVGAGMALLAAQGCRKQAAPAPATVVFNLPQVQLNFASGPLPVEDVDSGPAPRVEGVAQRQQQVQPVQEERADAQAAAAAAEAQRLEDARLLQRQEAASERQQNELDQEIEQDMRTQDEMEAEPRIQEVPEVPPQPVPLEWTRP
jgi:hypothetical protein